MSPLADLIAGWIPHDGGDCPVEPDLMVTIKTRAGTVTDMRAGAVVWRYGSFIAEIPGTLPAECEVVAYRFLIAMTPLESVPTLREVEEAARNLIARMPSGGLPVSGWIDARFAQALARSNAANAAAVQARMQLKAKVADKFGHLLNRGQRHG